MMILTFWLRLSRSAGLFANAGPLLDAGAECACTCQGSCLNRSCWRSAFSTLTNHASCGRRQGLQLERLIEALLLWKIRADIRGGDPDSNAGRGRSASHSPQRKMAHLVNWRTCSHFVGSGKDTRLHIGQAGRPARRPATVRAADPSPAVASGNNRHTDTRRRSACSTVTRTFSRAMIWLRRQVAERLPHRQPARNFLPPRGPR